MEVSEIAQAAQVISVVVGVVISVLSFNQTLDQGGRGSRTGGGQTVPGLAAEAL